MLKLADKIRDKTARIGIVGLGYVGLPLAIAFPESGFRVLGFDTQQKEEAEIVPVPSKTKTKIKTENLNLNLFLLWQGSRENSRDISQRQI